MPTPRFFRHQLDHPDAPSAAAAALTADGHVLFETAFISGSDLSHVTKTDLLTGTQTTLPLLLGFFYPRISTDGHFVSDAVSSFDSSATETSAPIYVVDTESLATVTTFSPRAPVATASSRL